MSKDKKIKRWSITLALIVSWCVLAAVIAERHFVGRVETMVSQQRAITEVRAVDLSESVRRNVHYLNGIPNMLSHLVRVNDATSRFGADVSASGLPVAQRKKIWTTDTKFNDLSRYLQVVQNNLSTDLIFLTNASGDAISASNWDSEGSPIGTNFSDRDWFPDNRLGKPGFQYAMGRTTHIPGLYFASPVMQGGRYTGSVVVKVNLPNLTFLMAQSDAFLTDKYGVIILAQDKAIELQALPDAPVYGLSEEAKLSRYVHTDFVTRKVLPWSEQAIPGLFQRDNDETPYLSVNHSLDEFGLTVYVEDALSGIHGLQRERWLGFLLMAVLGGGMIVAVTLLLFYLRRIRRANDKLQESENRYRTLIDSSPLCVHEIDLQGHFMSMNRSGLSMLGMEEGTVCGMPFLSAVSNQDHGRVAELFQQAIKGDGCNFEFFTAGNAPLYFKSCFIPILDSEGRVIKLMGLTEDITQRKRNEILLDGQKKVLEMIATATPLGQILDALVKLIESLSNDVLGSILLLDEAGEHLLHGAAPSLPLEYTKAIDGAPIGPAVGSCGTAAYRKESVYVADIATDPLWADYKFLALPLGLRACWSTPIFDTQQRVIATFALYLRQPGLPNAEHRQLIDTATHFASIAISRYLAERALRKSEIVFRTLFVSSQDALMTSSPELGFISCNPAALALFACHDEAKFLTLAPTDVSPEFQPDGRRSDEKSIEMMHIALEEGSYFFEWMHKRIDGHTFFADVLLTRIEIDGKRILHATVRDISERKRAALIEQQRLDELESMYRLSNTISNAETLEEIYDAAMDDLLHLLGADRVAVLLNDSEHAMRFMAWRGLSEEFRQRENGHSPWSEKDGEPRPIFVESVENSELNVATLKSMRQEGVCSFACLPLLQHGSLLGKLTVCFDQPHSYTQREMQLATTIASHIAIAIDRKHAEQQFADMFEFAPDALVMTDMQANIIMLNHQSELLFGYSKQELIGQPIDALIPKGRSEERRDMRQRFLNSAMRPRPLGGMSRKDLRGIAKDGRIFPVEISLSPMRSQNGMVIAAAVRDVSARQQVMEQLMLTARELEQANELVEEERSQLAHRVEERTSQLRIANRAKDSFLATMSHEIRTPLGGLLGMMELLSLTSLDGEQMETLQAARNSGKGLLRIVDDILDWSKIEAGKLQLAPRPATILPLLKGVVATYGQLASAKGIQLRYRYDESLSQAHLFDPLRLSQILNNFTSNAIKFTASGTVEISATLSSQQEGCDEVRLCVKDSGVGIDKEHLARLFQQYEQASPDTARMYGGTGLGLAICRSLAELMEGNISVESTSGVGSSFCFTTLLPIANLATQRDLQLQLARGEEAEVHELVATNSWHPVDEPISILVVDDHPVNRMLLKQQLEQLGLHADIAAYGIVALALWQTGHYDMLITDCHMPEMDGYELTRCIRDIEAQDGREPTPIVAWTANVMSEEEGRCKAAGMDDVLTKPTELAELQAMLRKWLTRSEQLLQVEEIESQPEVEAGDADATLADGAVISLELSALNKIAKTRAQQIEMLQEFTLHNRNDIAGLAAALQSGNPSAVSRGAHRIKGASRMVGAMQLAALCASIEQAASYGDMNSARTLAKGLYEANTTLEHDVARFIDAQ